MKFILVLGIVALLIVVGVGLYVTDFVAYLGNNPTTCNNCHVMDSVYESWYHGSHQAWATCGDCHTPHALIPKYITKGISGYHHVSAFILGKIPDAIRAKRDSLEVVQDNCVRCHTDTVDAILEMSLNYERFCFDCHRHVSHGERGVSLLPYQDK
ncbi:MAG: cytochrome c nitrite reductase small subunit [Chloroflexota bacterium]|nr:MAG: cytochrome c nitrite reductase small subunit [Chloroflexota bacterium]